MSYELRKILGNRYVMLLLALAVAVNAALFYRRCTEDNSGVFCWKYRKVCRTS